MKKAFYLGIFLLFFFASGFAQILEPVDWSFDKVKLSEDEYELVFTAKMDKGWTVYSQFTNDDGPVPTAVYYENGDFEKVGESEEFGKRKEGLDPYFDVMVIKYLDDEDFVIRQKIKLQDPSKDITGFLTYMTCDDTRCLPPTDVDFSFTFDSEDNSETSTSSININFDQNIDLTEVSQEGIIDPVKWSFEIDEEENGQYRLKYIAEMEPGWAVYSQFTSEDGPVPTTVWYDKAQHFNLIDSTFEKGQKKEGIDPFFDVQVTKYLDGEPFIIEHLVQVNDTEQDITGAIEYMACDDSRCLAPVYVDFKFNPQALLAGLNEISDEEINELTAEGGVVDNRISTIVESLEEPIGNCGGVQKIDKNLLLTFFFGFLGGLVALLTPCVFPMIPLTISFFTKDNKRKGWVNGMLYGVSIIVIYVSLGILLTLFFGEEALNRLSTNWIANSLFFLIFVFFAFSFFGYYEITLPSSWSNKSDRMADKGGIIGIFFMAFTLAIVSFSCTGPIIGSAIVEAASSKLGPAVVMLGFATALAIPFGLFAAFPSWLNSLPRSGSWMTSVKVVLGFIELALAFKFLSVADMTNHWGFLKYELFMGIWVLISVLLVLYLLGVIRFPHDAPVKKIKPARWGFIALFAVTAVYLLSGFRYSDQTQAYDSKLLLSGISPPAHYNFFLDKPDLDPDLKARFSSYDKCANNLDCFKDYYEGVEYAKEVNKPVFLDFTGHGCVNCRKTEEHIWVRDEIYEKLNNDFVLVSLYTDDDKKLDQVMLSKSRQKKIRDVGNMWADFQIVNFGSNAQPLYAMMTPDEYLLGKPRGYQTGVKSYNEFLECGLNEFKNLTPQIGSNLEKED